MPSTGSPGGGPHRRSSTPERGFVESKKLPQLGRSSPIAGLGFSPLRYPPRLRLVKSPDSLPDSSLPVLLLLLLLLLLDGFSPAAIAPEVSRTRVRCRVLWLLDEIEACFGGEAFATTVPKYTDNHLQVLLTDVACFTIGTTVWHELQCLRGPSSSPCEMGMEETVEGANSKDMEPPASEAI
ncbi:hypothetical protein NL676_012183 [Syzygium grande]|nr:hypothetical protein NL676_012183 [Syzygium grande]